MQRRDGITLRVRRFIRRVIKTIYATSLYGGRFGRRRVWRFYWQQSQLTKET